MLTRDGQYLLYIHFKYVFQIQNSIFHIYFFDIPVIKSVIAHTHRCLELYIGHSARDAAREKLFSVALVPNLSDHYFDSQVLQSPQFLDFLS